jgi:hypothetical protein
MLFLFLVIFLYEGNLVPANDKEFAIFLADSQSKNSSDAL